MSYLTETVITIDSRALEGRTWGELLLEIIDVFWSYDKALTGDPPSFPEVDQDEMRQEWDAMLQKDEQRWKSLLLNSISMAPGSEFIVLVHTFNHFSFHLSERVAWLLCERFRVPVRIYAYDSEIHVVNFQTYNYSYSRIPSKDRAGVYSPLEEWG